MRRVLGIAVTGAEGDRRPALDWRDRVERTAEMAHKERIRDHHDKISRLQGKVGEATMEKELLHGKIDRLEGGSP